MMPNIHFWSHLGQFFLEWERNVTDKIVDKIKTRILSNFFFKNVCCFWDNLEKYGEPSKPPMTVRRLSIACWIPKATNTYSEYVKLTDFPLQQWLHERASVLGLYLNFLPFSVCWCFTTECGRFDPSTQQIHLIYLSLQLHWKKKCSYELLSG